MSEAFRQMGTGRPLPVNVEIPLDVLDEPAMNGDLSEARRPEKTKPDPSNIVAAVELIKRSSKVALYLGGGAVQAGAPDTYIALAELLGAPIVLSVMGKGAVPEDHPLVVGALWDAGNDIDAMLREADCLIVFGSKLGAQLTREFTMPIARDLIRVDVDERELSLNATPTVGILGDAALAAEGMLQALRGSGFALTSFPVERVVAARKAAESGSWHAERRPYVDALRQAIPRDGVAVTDMTQMSYVASSLYPVYEPRTYMFPSGYGTLGFALPAAIGAKIARPEAPVVAVVGDGGFQFTMSELGTAVQERLGIPIVIFNDSTYSAVKEEQSVSRGARYIAVDLVNPDYVDLAKAYRIPGVRVESPDSLVSEISVAFERDLPTIIDVPIEPWV
jgi:thiamine pyrophosphate-dependent acetolactate synthase large subunit-like protein